MKINLTLIKGLLIKLFKITALMALGFLSLVFKALAAGAAAEPADDKKDKFDSMPLVHTEHGLDYDTPTVYQRASIFK